MESRWESVEKSVGRISGKEVIGGEVSRRFNGRGVRVRGRRSEHTAK